ncbi:SDR family oxidoreductase [Salisaeta longa]|uniref:SDR family oxidoreductase n=1 Tax=Salisaeta longa TaxID=503170 RepID=UPI0003B5F7F3|nr:SDR family oxidoreductase [Salisaeta longa]
MAAAKHILVTGATGYVGGRLVPCLLREGYRVRCFVRDARRVQARPWADRVEIVEGDALERDTVGPAMQGIDAAYYLIHSLGAGASFAERDRMAATNVRAAAADAGVGRIIYLGGIQPKGEQQSKHLRSRLETGDVLREGPVPVTELRAAVIVGSGSLSFELVRSLTERVPVMLCPRWVQTPTQPIAIRNVLQYLVATLSTPESTGETIEIGGSDVLTYGDMFQIYAKVRGLKRRIVNVPFLTPRLSSYWVGFVTPVSSTIARPLIEGLDNEVTVDRPEVARTMFPSVRPISYEAAVRLALRRAASGDLPTVWNSAQSSVPSAPDDTPTLEVTEGLFRETRTATVQTSPAAAFAEIERLGGRNGWGYADSLWRLRGRIDQLLGGVGFRAGRRDAETLRPGDAVDFWRVEALEANRLVRFRAEMKLPGRAWLQYEVTPAAAETRITQTVFFEPRGLWGTLYWYLVAPVHRWVFRGMLRALTQRIRQREAPAAREALPTT